MDDDLRALAEGQRGLARRDQLAGLGVTAAQLRWRLGRTWRLVLPRVVALDTASLTDGRRAAAAALEAGEGAVVTGAYACAWHGLDHVRLDGQVHVLVEASKASRTTGFARIRRTTLHPASDRAGVVGYATVPRAVVDCACDARTPDEAEAVVVQAVQRRLVTVEQLRHELERRRANGTRVARAALAVAEAGAWSVPEASVLRAVAASTVLPHAWPNPELRLPDGTPLVSPDLWFDDVGIAVMVHSRAYHSRDADWERTVEQDGRLTEHGVLVLAFTGATARRRPDEVVRRVERAYLTARRSGRRRPDVVMVPRGRGLA
ncbi:hypothetical protein GCM10027446_02170 [Angustibacter peucedani]